MGKCISSVKREFSCANFSLQHDNPNDFHLSQWKSISPLLHCALRFVIALWLFIWLIVELVIVASPRYLLYMTHYGYLIVLAYFITATANSIQKIRMKVHHNLPTTSHLHRAQWVIFNMASALAFLVAIGYWGLLYRNNESQPNDLWNTFKRIHKHGGTFLLMAVETMISRLPHRIAHVIHPVIFTTSYLLFHCIYNVIANDSPYGSLLDYRGSPIKATIVTVGMIIAMPFGHAFIHLMYQLRRYIAKATGHQADDEYLTNDKGIQLDAEKNADIEFNSNITT